ncbi:MAG: hypothetical protein J6J78_02620, partial [Clostridia bacterium]|nr:hypothetical protein [Clostridia bacterium]
MKQKKAKRAAIICLTFILIIQIAVFVYFGNAKQGYHHDEILSFQISNYFENRSSYNISSKSDYYNNWHDAEYFKSALPAREGNLFNFLEVCDNVRKDNHPVLFYGAFHAVCSLFPEVFSKWLGIIPNVLYFIVTQIALYAIGCRIGKSRIFALLLVAAYGFSAAAISSVMLIRMYAMLAMWAVMQTYCHLRIYENCNEKKWYVFAGILTFCGVNTQYYYVVFQFFVSAVCFIYMFIKYRWKKAMTYAASIFAGLGATVIAWPFII